jgi:hypothetical protein
MYQVYQLGMNTSVTLNLLCFGPERKLGSITSISSMNMCLILKSMVTVERHIIVGSVLRDRLKMSLKLTTMRS